MERREIAEEGAAAIAVQQAGARVLFLLRKGAASWRKVEALPRGDPKEPHQELEAAEFQAQKDSYGVPERQESAGRTLSIPERAQDAGAEDSLRAAPRASLPRPALLLIARSLLIRIQLTWSPSVFCPFVPA